MSIQAAAAQDAAHIRESARNDPEFAGRGGVWVSTGLGPEAAARVNPRHEAGGCPWYQAACLQNPGGFPDEPESNGMCHKRVYCIYCDVACVFI